MFARPYLLIISVAVLVLAFAVEILLPAYSTLVFYALLAWVIASFLLFRGPSSSRGFGGRSMSGPAPPPAPVPPGSGAPLPSSNPASIGFCIYCGSALPPAATKCPACGHAVAPV